MSRLVLAYAFFAAAFLSMDAVWLSQVGPRLYAPALGPMLTDKPRLLPAILFYAVYFFGATRLAVAPALREGGVMRAAANGAILGLCAYATYDLTNQATLRIWSTRVTVFDLGWGAFATATAAGVSCALTAWTASRRGRRSEGA